MKSLTLKFFFRHEVVEKSEKPGFGVPRYPNLKSVARRAFTTKYRVGGFNVYKECVSLISPHNVTGPSHKWASHLESP